MPRWGLQIPKREKIPNVWTRSIRLNNKIWTISKLLTECILYTHSYYFDFLSHEAWWSGRGRGAHELGAMEFWVGSVSCTPLICFPYEPSTFCLYYWILWTTCVIFFCVCVVDFQFIKCYWTMSYLILISLYVCKFKGFKFYVFLIIFKSVT